MKNASSRASCDGNRFSNGQLEISGTATHAINRKSPEGANTRWRSGPRAPANNPPAFALRLAARGAGREDCAMLRFMSPLATPRAATLGILGMLAAASIGAAGCLLQASFAAKVTTADGVEIEVPLSTAVTEISDGPVKIKNFRFMPMKMEVGNGIVFAFQLNFEQGAKPASITVDDITDDPILNVYNDNAPVLTKGNNWNAVSHAHSPADEYAKWLMTLDNTVKVYRFTVKMADGTTRILRYPVFVPAQLKKFVRAQLGVTA
jgi:hypothetical protein